MKNRTALALRILLLLLFVVPTGLAQQKPASNDTSDLATYIDKTWDTLTRSMDNCEVILDRRVPEHSLLYLPADFPETDALKELGTRCKLAIEHLPQRITAPGTLSSDKLPRQGVLYLPNPYVVPGGFFNEMYGWDSYFIIRGLLRAGRVKMAQGMVENFFFEIDHYGSILNANRTYFLTRSQPPFLSSMVMGVYDALPDPKAKRAWLEKAYPYIQRDYDLWTHGEHLAGDTGLSRYFDYGQGPVPEIATMHDSYYRDVFTHIQASPERAEYLKDESKPDGATLIGPSFTFEACEQDEVGCLKSPAMKYTADYYKGDRAMRESGFDISFRFGPFSGSTHHFAAVCLNSLLYKAETDMEKIATTLGKPSEAKQWAERARHRKELVNKYLWDASTGMFFDYDFTKKKRSNYEYLTTFYPLWVGLASPEQAKAVTARLKVFERDGGVMLSPYETGVQWDAPYGWAPTELIAVEGMRRYGATADADRVARKWVNTVDKNFRREGTIREKYNMETQSSEANVTAGYKQNVVGFGWTNGVTLEFMHELGMLKEKAAAAKAGASR
ncbi:MAG: trehalase family glycosidase [Acidobacteriaceae bacterium]